MKKNNRPKIPQKTQLKLWIKSGGRCSFKGCNKELWHDGLTLKEGNYANIAHIIAYSPDGPRGDKLLSPVHAINYDNLMLMCQTHAKLIDDKDKVEEHPAQLLRKWKNEHESRIMVQTEVSSDSYKTSIIKFVYNIGDNYVRIKNDDIFKAIYPFYPVDLKGLVISESDFKRDDPAEIWEGEKEKISRKITRFLDESIENDSINHISLFALGPMPLLMALGKSLGDKTTVRIFPHLNSSEIANPWKWPENDSSVTEYVLNKVMNNNKAKDIAVLFSLSDKILPFKYENVIDENWTIYEITQKEPIRHFVKNPSQIESFRHEFRKVLNEILNDYSSDCTIHIFPAMPATLAIKCGQEIQPKDPQTWVYEYYLEKGFQKVLRLH